MRKRNVRAAIAAALCMTVLAAGCGKKVDDPVFTGDKTEAPVYQANLDAIKSSAYASADNLDLEPGTYISVIGRGSSTPYWNQVKAGVEQAATDLNTALGYSGNDKVKVLYSAPDENDNIDQQVNILDEELARYPDVIAISSVDASACSVQFDLAIENGIPIVAFDSGNSYQNIQSTCKTNNIEAATTGTKNFCEKIGDSGEILLLVHDTVSDTAKEREAGIKNELAANHPNVTVTETIYLDQLEMLKKQIVAEQVGVTPEELAAAEAGEKKEETTGTGDASETIADAASNAASSSADESANETAQEVDNSLSTSCAVSFALSSADESANETAQEVDNELSEKMQQVNDGAAKMSDEDAIRYYMEKHPDLKGCIATNETVTQLAIKTMDQLDAEKHITLVGFDAGKEQVNALKDGKVDGLIVQNPFGMGYATVVAAARTVLEIGNEAEVNTGYVWVTADNMNDDTITPFLYE